MKLKKYCVWILGVYIIFSALFLTLAKEKIIYTKENNVFVGKEIDRNTDELVDGDVIEQTCQVKGDYLTGIKIYCQTYGRDKLQGTFDVEVFDSAGQRKLASASIASDKLVDSEWNSIDFASRIDMSSVSEQRIMVCITNHGGKIGETVTICYSSQKENNADELKIRGTVIEKGALSLLTVETSLSAYRYFYLPVIMILFGIILLYCIAMIRAEKCGKENLGLHFYHVFQKYSFLLTQLVSRDFKTKYKRSVLGVFWSFLNPLLTMCVQYIVFSNLFKFKIPNYAVYLLTGIILYNGFNDTTTQAMTSITGNVSLITKVYVPKYIYPIAKTFSTCINLVLSFIPMFLVAIFTGVKLQPSILLLPYVLICFIVFMIGMSFILSTAMVFFRDMQFLWGVFTMIWMYATPIMYPIDLLPEWMQKVELFNPLYHYISFFRTILIDGVSPEPVTYLYCFGFAIGVLLLGGFVFKKNQDKFVLYI